MLPIIVLYLSIFGSSTNENIFQNECLQADSNCFMNADCCSKSCYSLPGSSYRRCVEVTKKRNTTPINNDKKMTSSLTITKLETPPCIENNQKCYENVDCCTNNCSKKTGEIFGTCNTKNDFCFEFNHFCISNDDCCSGKCFKVVVTFAPIVAHACLE